MKTAQPALATGHEGRVASRARGWAVDAHRWRPGRAHVVHCPVCGPGIPGHLLVTAACLQRLPGPLPLPRARRQGRVALPIEARSEDPEGESVFLETRLPSFSARSQGRLRTRPALGRARPVHTRRKPKPRTRPQARLPSTARRQRQAAHQGGEQDTAASRGPAVAGGRTCPRSTLH